MPYLPPDESGATWDRDRRHILISGEPDSGKTTSLATFDRPVHIVSVPGEMGTASMVREEGVVPHKFATPDPNKPRTWQQDWLDTVNLCLMIGAGKHGECRTLAIDGIHKLYDVAMAVVTHGAYMASTGEYEARKFSNGWNLFKDFLDKMFGLPVETIVMTCWFDWEKDDAEDKSKDAKRSLMPALPGKSAQRIMGEFAIRLGAFGEGTGPARRFFWATTPQGRIKGAGIKAPLAIAQKVPPRVPQDWQALKGHLGL